MESAIAYGRMLKARFGDGGPDITMLGMGDDGHTASLFPYTPAVAETHHRCTAQFVEKSTTGAHLAHHDDRAIHQSVSHGPADDHRCLQGRKAKRSARRPDRFKPNARTTDQYPRPARPSGCSMSPPPHNCTSEQTVKPGPQRVMTHSSQKLIPPTFSNNYQTKTLHAPAP